MKKLEEILGEELYKQVTEKLGDNSDKLVYVQEGNWIPKDKFNEVNNSVKDLKKQLSDRDKQLEDLGTKVTDISELQSTIDTLKADNLKTQKEYETNLQKQKFDFTLENALATVKAKNSKVIKGLLDIDKIKLNEEGTLEGFKEQIEEIKKTDDYLFVATEVIKGANANLNTNSSKGSSNPFRKDNFNLTEQGKLFRENPTLAKTLMEQANAE